MSLGKISMVYISPKHYGRRLRRKISRVIVGNYVTAPSTCNFSRYIKKIYSRPLTFTNNRSMTDKWLEISLSNLLTTCLTKWLA